MSFNQYKAECASCPLEQESKNTLCPVCLTQRVLRGKWKIVLIWLMRNGGMRFSELKKSVPHITQAYLSSHLKDLESDNLVVRKSYKEVPPRVEYSLTREGRNFIRVIETLKSWGMEYSMAQKERGAEQG